MTGPIEAARRRNARARRALLDASGGLGSHRDDVEARALRAGQEVLRIHGIPEWQDDPVLEIVGVVEVAECGACSYDDRRVEWPCPTAAVWVALAEEHLA